MVTNKRVLITGGTGSFGHQIVQRLMDEKPAEIRIFSRDEEKQIQMSHDLEVGADYPRKGKLSFVLGDVRSKDSLKRALIDIDIVFHAAALKQVPSCEYNVLEAVQTNVWGAQNVIDVAFDSGVERVIAISTDKAVKPVNAMGMTKALQEKMFTSANYSKGSRSTVFSCVRYGNVIGSRGSVIPLFRKQIAKGGPVTITHPEMTRFVITLPEAIDLAFHAGKESIGGEIFTPKIPAMNIVDLAEVMVEKLGGGKDIKIENIGVRQGEKIHEALISEAEMLRTVDQGRYFAILPQIDVPGVSEKYAKEKPVEFFEYASNIADKLDKRQIADVLKSGGWLK